MNTSDSLTRLAIEHGTDKCDLGYTKHYFETFGLIRGNIHTLIEIGVYKGDSLRMWRDWFLTADIYGIEIREERQLEETRIKTFCGSQADRSFMLTVLQKTGPLDIVIDDGSHRGVDHLAAWDILWPALRSGGWYCIEDCQSLFDEHWTKACDPTILDTVSNHFRPILTGTGDIAEVRILGQSLDGLIMMRKR